MCFRKDVMTGSDFHKNAVPISNFPFRQKLAMEFFSEMERIQGIQVQVL